MCLTCLAWLTLTSLSFWTCTPSCSRGMARPALAPSRCLTMVLRCIPVMPWHVMSESGFAMAHPAEWWVRPQSQQDLPPMVGLQGTCEVGGIPVACWQWARRFSWACTICPWMGFTQTHLQSSSNTAACSTARAWCQCPGNARGHGTRWGIPEGLLWQHAHHQVGVGVR